MLEKISEIFINNKLTLSTAESCTAGGISSKLCSLPGASNYFNGSVVAYSNKIKTDFLGVSCDDIINYSEVSKQVSLSMSELVSKKFNSDFSISTTGYAGPEGKDIGKVFISIKTPINNKCSEFFFTGDRSVIINKTINKALDELLSEINLYILMKSKRN